MTSESTGMPNKKRKTIVGAIMDKELDESLHEIKKLLFLNAWINLMNAKGICKTPEGEHELEDIHQILDTVMSQWTFQQELK